MVHLTLSKLNIKYLHDSFKHKHTQKGFKGKIIEKIKDTLKNIYMPQ